jgi:hypothetical protein
MAKRPKSAARADRDKLFATRWVHVFEEDTPEGAVYRPEDDKIPLSRRPRERLELDPDGTARVLKPGPDDRYVAQPATWNAKGQEAGRRAAQGGATLEIVEQSPTRLVVKKTPRT